MLTLCCGRGDSWACNCREAKVRGKNDLQQERWESNTRWCVTKPAIASAQNRDSHLVMWNDTGEAVFQNLSALDQFIRETKDEQFICCVSVDFPVSHWSDSHTFLVLLPVSSSQAAFGKARASEGTICIVPGHDRLTFQVVALGSGAVSDGSQSSSDLAHKLSLVQTLTNLSGVSALLRTSFSSPVNRIHWTRWFQRSYSFYVMF